MSDLAIQIVFITGVLVWLLIAIGSVFFVAFFVVPDAWRWLCLQGYLAFADQAEKDELRRSIRERAERRAAMIGEEAKP